MTFIRAYDNDNHNKTTEKRKRQTDRRTERGTVADTETKKTHRNRDTEIRKAR